MCDTCMYVRTYRLYHSVLCNTQYATIAEVKSTQAATFLLYGAACPSSLSSSMMGEIDLLLSQIPASVLLFFFE